MKQNQNTFAWEDDNGAPVDIHDFPEVVSDNNAY